MPNFPENIMAAVGDGTLNLKSYTGEMACNIGTNALRAGTKWHGSRYRTPFKKGCAYLARRLTAKRAFKLMAIHENGGFVSNKQLRQIDKHIHLPDVGTATVHVQSLTEYYSRLSESHGVPFGDGDFGHISSENTGEYM